MLVVPSRTRTAKKGIIIRIKFPYGFSRAQQAYAVYCIFPNRKRMFGYGPDEQLAKPNVVFRTLMFGTRYVTNVD